MKNLEYYLSLKYPIELIETQEDFVASHPDLPGCHSFGDTVQGALEGLAEVRALWLEGYYKAHGEAPEPRDEDDYSGKFVVRVPKWLHRALERFAKKQEISLNQLVVSVLAKGVTEAQVESFAQRLGETVERIQAALATRAETMPVFSASVQMDKAPEYVVESFAVSQRFLEQSALRVRSLQGAVITRDEDVLELVSAKFSNRFDTKIRPFIK